MFTLRKVLYACLSLLVVVIISLPIAWGVLTSLKTRVVALSSPPQILFDSTLDNYYSLWEGQGMSLLNSAAVATLSSLGSVVLGFPLAFLLSRIDRRKAISHSLQILAVRLMPPTMMVVPLYLAFRTWSLMDGYLGIVLVHCAASLPIAVIAMKIAMDEVPRSLDECCLLEGDALTWFLFRQMRHAAMPGIVLACTFCFVSSWNEFYFASRLTGQDHSTFTIAVAGLVTPHGTNWGKVTAMATIGILPGIVAAWLSFRRLSIAH